MANVHVPVDPLDELRLRTPAVPDRLPAMLFLAALVHGILIIGVTFNPQLSNPFADAISLEVTIVADPDQQIDRPDEAAYLAKEGVELLQGWFFGKPSLEPAWKGEAQDTSAPAATADWSDGQDQPQRAAN